MRKYFDKDLFGIIVSLVLLVVLFSLLSAYFLTVNNLLTILLQVSVISVMAFGMTYALMIGGIDLSVGAIAALAGMVFALVLQSAESLILACAAAMLVGILAGLTNGLLVSRLSIPPFIVTVATMGIFRGVAYSFTDSKAVPIDAEAALFIGNGNFAYIPFPVWIMFFLLFTSHLILSKTKIGRQAKLIGGNREAARYAGVKIAKIETLVFMITAFSASVSGVILASRLYSAQPNSSMGYELDAIAAAVLGGTSLSGGSGTVVGTFLGALIIGVVNTGMNLLGLPYFYQLVIKGVIILVAVYLDIRNKKKNG